MKVVISVATLTRSIASIAWEGLWVFCHCLFLKYAIIVSFFVFFVYERGFCVCLIGGFFGQNRCMPHFVG